MRLPKLFGERKPRVVTTLADDGRHVASTNSLQWRVGFKTFSCPIGELWELYLVLGVGDDDK